MIIDLRHFLHRYPELSMKETKTKETLMHFLRAHTTMRLQDCGTWFYAVAGEEKAGRPIAFRTEMDALPVGETTGLPYASEHTGISHACGHDGHMASLCGLALALEEKPADRPVYLIFQPGEEIGAGGEVCAQFVAEKGIAEVYAFHNLDGYPVGSIVVREGLTQPASKGLQISFKGQCAHASEPEKGKNPARAIANVITQVAQLLQETWTGMVLCTIVEVRIGAEDYGVSAGDGRIAMTLRAEHESEMGQLEAEILSYAQKQADRFGLGMTKRERDYFPETRNHAHSLQRIRDAAKKLDYALIEMDHLWRASEDFGYYTKATDGAMFYIGTGMDRPALHSPVYDFNDAIIPVAVDVMYELALS